MNYMTLLAKYIDYVYEMDGADLIIGYFNGTSGHLVFSDEEWKELQAIAKGLEADRRLREN